MTHYCPDMSPARRDNARQCSQTYFRIVSPATSVGGMARYCRGVRLLGRSQMNLSMEKAGKDMQNAIPLPIEVPIGIARANHGTGVPVPISPAIEAFQTPTGGVASKPCRGWFPSWGQSPHSPLPRKDPRGGEVKPCCVAQGVACVGVTPWEEH